MLGVQFGVFTNVSNVVFWLRSCRWYGLRYTDAMSGESATTIPARWRSFSYLRGCNSLSEHTKEPMARVEEVNTSNSNMG